MIRVTDINGKAHLVNAQGILQVQEASAASHWHGVRAYVRLFDGRTIEARETINEISLLIEQEKATS